MYDNERDFQSWDEWKVYATRLADIPEGSDRLLFYREKASHRGISSYQHVTKLKARQVNQDFLEEISQLKGLTYLELYSITADDLWPLTRLQSLTTLKLEAVRSARDFSPVLALSSLRRLFITHAKHLKNVEFLADSHQLVSLGIEGSMWTHQTIDSLQPLSNLLNLEALFMVSARLRDKNLSYVATIPNLRIFDCARLAPKESFVELRRLMPQLECCWCDEYEIHLPKDWP